MLMNPKSIDLNQKRKLKSASRPFNFLGSRFITAAPCFWHGAAERVVVENRCRQRTGGHPALAGAYAPMRFPSGPDTPFPKHWLYYIVLKYVVIAAAVLIAIYVASQLL